MYHDAEWPDEVSKIATTTSGRQVKGRPKA